MNNEDKSYHLYLMCICVIMLIITGCVFIYSSSTVSALEHIGSGNYYLKKQCIGIILGIIGLFITLCIPIAWIKKGAPYLFIAALIGAAITLTPLGTSIHGSRRWLMWKSISLQPSEFLKHAYTLYLAFFIQKKELVLNSFTRFYLPCLIICAITSLILLKQPDFGMTMTLCMTTFLIVFIAAIPTRFLLGTLAAGIPVITYLVLKTPYRLHRIMSFLNPWHDPQGSGFQIIQSLIAIGSGGFWGLGIGSSKQKFFYLPMQHTDFIFSIIAEETGFLGTSIIILLFILFLYAGLTCAWACHETFARYTILGFTITTSLQALTNLMVTSGLLPTKGVGLPFISYGSSALIANLLMLGVVISLITSAKKALFY